MTMALKEYQNILVEISGRIATLTVNRPEVLNALNETVLLEIEDALGSLQDTNTKVLIITGAGDKAFVAGADIKAMSAMDSKDARQLAVLGHRVMQLIEEYPMPVIAAINGFAIGGGCELALACDLIIASEIAKFGQPEINLGIICGFGASQRLARRIGISRAKEMLFTGNIIDAETAEKLGIVNKTVSAGELLETAQKLAKNIASKPKLALQLTKSVVNKVMHSHHHEGLGFEVDCFAKCFDTEDQKEGMAAFLEKRAPEFKS